MVAKGQEMVREKKKGQAKVREFQFKSEKIKIIFERSQGKVKF